MAKKALILMMICLMLASPVFAVGRRSDVPNVPFL